MESWRILPNISWNVGLYRESAARHCHFENVEDIKFVAEGEIDETNLDIVLAEFANRGYECQQMFGDSSKYGVPHRRKRFYIVAMLVAANSHVYCVGSVNP